MSDDEEEWMARYAAERALEEPWKGVCAPIVWKMDNWRKLYPPIGEILRARTTIEDFLRSYYDDSSGIMAPHYVYFLMEDWEVFYVGQTHNPDWRFKSHRMRWPNLVHLSIHRVPGMFVDSVEAFYIDLLDPPENVKREVGCTVSDDLYEAARKGQLYGNEPIRFRRSRIHYEAASRNFARPRGGRKAPGSKGRRPVAVP